MYQKSFKRGFKKITSDSNNNISNTSALCCWIIKLTSSEMGILFDQETEYNLISPVASCTHFYFLWP